MDKEKLKLIVRNMESLVECLKSELDSDDSTSDSLQTYQSPYLTDYDEVFYEDE